MKSIKIKSIKYIGKRKVYDIIMKKNHNFLLSNGILSHNSEVRGLIQGQYHLLCVTQMTNELGREFLLKPLERLGRMSIGQISYIDHQIKKWQLCVVEKSSKAKILKRINPPRCRYWKNQNFYSTWKEEVNKWVKSDEMIKDIEQEYKDRVKGVEKQIKEKKEEKIQEKIEEIETKTPEVIVKNEKPEPTPPVALFE